MSELVSHDILTGQSAPINRARLESRDWYIEITKLDDQTIELRCAGLVAGSESLRVVPVAGNTIRVTTTVEIDRRIYEAANRVIAVEKANASPPMRRQP